MVVNRIKNIFYNIKDGLKRFPELAINSVAILVFSILLNHNQEVLNISIDNLEKLLYVFFLGALLFSFPVLIQEMKNKNIRFKYDAIVILALITFYYIFPKDFNAKFFIRYFSIFIISILGMLSIQGFKNNNYQMYILKVVSNFLVSFIFSLTIFLGMSAIFLTIEKLFLIDFYSEIYFDIFISIFSIFGINYFYALFPEENIEFNNMNFPSLLKKLIFYIIIPLLSVYTIILYFYFTRIIILQEFPINLLSHLVLWYGFFSVIVLFFINKIKDQKNHVKLFYKYFPLVIMIPLGMLFLAISRRISNFGFTPPRYYVVLLGIWIFLSMIYIYKSKKFKSKNLVLLAIIFLIIPIYGPQSAFNISRNSQEKRFINILNNQEMIENGEIIKSQDISHNNQQKINDFLSYFDKYDQIDKIDILPKDYSLKNSEDFFGFEYKRYYRNIDRDIIKYSFYNKFNNTPINIEDYNYMLDMSINLDSNVKKEYDNINYEFDSSKNILKFIVEDKKKIEINIENLIKDFDKKLKGKSLDKLDDTIIENENYKLYIERIYFRNSNDGNMRFKILLNKK